MNDPSAPDQQVAFWGRAWVTAILLVATAFAIGLGAKLAFSTEDTEAARDAAFDVGRPAVVPESPGALRAIRP